MTTNIAKCTKDNILLVGGGAVDFVDGKTLQDALGPTAQLYQEGELVKPPNVLPACLKNGRILSVDGKKYTIQVEQGFVAQITDVSAPLSTSQFHKRVVDLISPSLSEVQDGLPVLDSTAQQKIESFCEQFKPKQRGKTLTHDDGVNYINDFFADLNQIFELGLIITKNLKGGGTEKKEKQTKEANKETQGNGKGKGKEEKDKEKEKAKQEKDTKTGKGKGKEKEEKNKGEEKMKQEKDKGKGKRGEKEEEEEGCVRIPDLYIKKSDISCLDGDVKLTWDLTLGGAADIFRLPTGASRNIQGYLIEKRSYGGSTSVPRGGVDQLFIRARSYFNSNPEAEMTRAFLSDSDHWFFLKIFRKQKDGAFMFATEEYNFSLSIEKEVAEGEEEKEIQMESNIQPSKSKKRKSKTNGNSGSDSVKKVKVGEVEDKQQQKIEFITLVYRQLLALKLEAQVAPARLYKYIEPYRIDADKRVVHVRNHFSEKEEFTILSILGQGAKSIVYRARCHKTSQEVALKFEPASACCQLTNEITMLGVLAGVPGVPTLLSSGTTLDGSQCYSATDVVGFSICEYEWSMQQLQLLWEAAVDIITKIHAKGIVLMDLKPRHFILSLHGLFIIDYGLSYFLSVGRDITLLMSSSMFSSVKESNHIANPGYRADWESLVFCFIYLKQRKLPWLKKGISEKQRINMKCKVLKQFPELPPLYAPMLDG